MECQGLFGRWFGHKFKPRYSLSEPTVEIKINSTTDVDADDAAAMLEASKRKTYHGDVCTRCGNLVNSQSN